MKKIIRLLMVLLSYAPIATVAVAAQAKASEIDGEEQNLVLLKAFRKTRYRLMPDGLAAISIERAKKRYAKVTGLHGVDLEQSINQDIQFMLENGLIQINEKDIIPNGPSQFAIK